MAKLILQVWDVFGKLKRDIQVPDNAIGRKLVAALQEKMHMPALDSAGQKQTYSLLHRQSGLELPSDRSLTEAGVKHGDDLQWIIVESPEVQVSGSAPESGPDARSTTTGGYQAADPQSREAAASNRNQPHPAEDGSPKPGINVKRRTMAVGAVLLLGAFYVLPERPEKVEARKPAIVEPEKSPEELRRERMSAATMAVWNKTARFHQEELSQFSYYDLNYARAFTEFYELLQLNDDVDEQYQAWVNETLAAAKSFVELEDARVAALDALTSSRDSDMVGTAIQGASEGANWGDTAQERFAAGALGALVGAWGSSLNTEAKQQEINKKCRSLSNAKSQVLAAQDRKRNRLLEALQERYGWHSTES